MKTKQLLFALAMGLVSNLSVNASEIVAATLILEAGGVSIQSALWKP